MIIMAKNYSRDIECSEVRERLERGEALNIIDVREDEEWEAGNIPGAKHIPLGVLGQRLDELDRQKEYIFVCRSGNRSGIACEHLEAMGYNVINMTGGMLCWDGEVEYGK